MTDQYSVSNIESAIKFAKDGIVSKTLLNAPKSKGCPVLHGGRTIPFGTHRQYARHDSLSWRKWKANARGDEHRAKEGVWVHMPAGQLHAIDAESDLVFLLTLFR
ncbi:MAG: hypothetical protein ACE5QW_03045 [Thermoplasmata archaeon]